MKRYLLATRSPHKAREIRTILAPHGEAELISLADLGSAESNEEDVLEDADTFLGNARAKALYFAGLTGIDTIADDSGLEVAALGNAPGVRTRRFALDAGRTGLSGTALDQANNELLLERLDGLPASQREARYVCAAVLATPGGKLSAAIGTCSGIIGTEHRGTNGFGYDPLFLLPDLGLTFAQIPAQEKQARSHRARAFRALVIMLD